MSGSYVLGLTLMLLALIYILWLATGGNIRRIRCIVHGYCEYEWQFNSHKVLNPITFELSGVPRTMLIGHYKCPRCHTWSEGCARHEQRSREIHESDIPPVIPAVVTREQL